ncbi:MAG: hypothetical protein ABI222_13345 [Opitutaceae bacterium]
MNTLRFGCLVLVLTAAPAMLAQTTAVTVGTPMTATASQPVDAQAKALREQVEREAAARKAEADAAIAADIARHPDGPNAIAARKAAEDKKTLELAKQTAEDKAKAAADTAVKSAANKEEADRKTADDAWAAAAPERERAAAKKKAAIAKWRATAKPAPSIMMSHRPDGTFTVMVDGKISTFQTATEAQAFANKARDAADSGLAY